MKKITCAVFLLITTLSVFGQTVTKERSIELAIENNLQLRATAEDVSFAEAYYREVRSSLLPQIQLTGGYQLNRTELRSSMIPERLSISDMLSPAADDDTRMLAGFLEEGLNAMLPDKTQEETTFAAGIKLDQVVYLGGKLMSGIRAADRYKTLEARRYELKKREIVFTTIDMFYQGLLLSELLEINRQAIEIAQRHYDRVTDMYDQGMVSEFDLIRAELELEKLRPELRQAENNYNIWLESFSKHIGVDKEGLSLEGQIELPDILSKPIEDAVETGKDNRLELGLAKTMEEMYEIQYRAERGNYLPNVALSAEYNTFSRKNELKTSPGDFASSYQVMLGLQMPLFTGFGNTSKVAQARHEHRKAKLERLDLKDKIRLDITNAWQGLEYAVESYEAQRKLVALAEKGLEIATTRYESQIGINLEVLDAQLEYNLANLSLMQSLYEVNIAQAKLKQAMGIKLY